MKVTVCELSNEPDELARQWDALGEHVQAQQSELVLLPEMPFSPWLAYRRQPDRGAWAQAVEQHEAWLERHAELGAPIVLGTRPVLDGGQAYNQAYVWTEESGARAVHRKYYLPDEAEFWEASWYSRGSKSFEVVEVQGVKIAFLVCTEIWFTEHARSFARQGLHILACPRATAAYSTSKWLAGGRAAAVMSGAFCLSSNRGGRDANGMTWGSAGWIVDPQEAELLAQTDAGRPFQTVDIDLRIAEDAKRTYPRYVLE